MLTRAALAPALVLLAGTAWAEPGAPPPPAPANAPAPAPVVEDAPAPPAGAPAAAPAPPADEAAGRRTPFGVMAPPADMIRENSRLLDRARAAREAARAGSCRIALDHAAKAREIDRDFHDRLLAHDPLIAPCIDPEAHPRYRMELREIHADPPASGARIFGELFLGMVTGAGGAIVGALIGSGLCIGGGDDGDCDASTIGGAYAAGILTIPLGVRAAGSSGGQTGSLGMTYLGAAVGGLGGLLMLANDHDEITSLGLLFAPTIGAIVGFNTTRRYKPRRVRVRVPVTGSLVDWSDGEVTLGVPLVTRARAEERAVTSVPLLGGTF